MSVSRNFIPEFAVKNINPLNFPDCIYLTEACRCEILRVSVCIGSGCAFCQNKTARGISENIWFCRMNSLEDNEQSRIAEKYYGGNMPWKA